MPSARHGVTGIDSEVQYGRFDLMLIHKGFPEIRAEFHFDIDVFTQRSLKERLHPNNGIIDVYNLGHEGLFSRERKKPLSQGSGAIARADDVANKSPAGFRCGIQALL